MPKLLTTFALLILTGQLFSQDLLVTHAGDSINCRIQSVKHDFIYYRILMNSEFKTLAMKAGDVKTIQYKYFTSGRGYSSDLSPDEKAEHWKLSFHTGYSHRIAKIGDNVPAALKEYVNKTRPGMHFNAEMLYFMKNNLGFGLQYCYNHTKAKSENYLIGEFSDNISIRFFGPVFSFRAYNHTMKNNVYMSFALGYLGYKDKGTVNSENVLIKGSTAGLKYDAGYDIGIAKNTSLGFQMSYLTGIITEITVTQGYISQVKKLEKENYENLGRLDLSIGLKFNW